MNGHRYPCQSLRASARQLPAAVLLTFIALFPAFGQYDLSYLYQPNFLPLVDPREYVDVEFKWDVPGKAQAYLNSGITELKEGSPLLALENFSESIHLYPFWATYYYRGVSHKRLKQYEEAESDLLKVLELERECAEAHLALGEIHQLRSNHEKAQSQYERAIRLKPSFVHAYYRIGSLYFIKSENSKAIRYYEKCITIDPKFPNAYLGMGLLKFSERKKDRDAIVYFDKAIEADPAYKDGLFWRGLAYITLEEYQKALADWDLLARVTPENPFVLIYRASLHMKMNQYDLAFRDLRNALMSNHEDEDKFAGQQTDLDKRIDLQAAVGYLDRYGYGLQDESLSHIKKGFCLLITEQKAEAIRNFKASARMEPSACAHYLTAIGYEHIRKFDSAYYFYDFALRFDPDLFDAYKKRAIFRYELKDWKGSLSDFNQMIRLQPESPMTYRLRGLIRAHMKDYYGCIVDLARVIQSDSTDSEAWKTRGFCRKQVKDTLGAFADFREYLRIDRSEFELYEMMTVGYLQMKDTTSALQVLTEYHEAYPRFTYPYLMKAKLFIEMRDYTSARKQIDDLYKIVTPTYSDREVYFNTILLDGIIELHIGRASNAIDLLSEAMKINPKDPEVRYYRFKAYNKAGDTRKASEDLKVLKKLNYRDSASL